MARPYTVKQAGPGLPMSPFHPAPPPSRTYPHGLHQLRQRLVDRDALLRGQEVMHSWNFAAEVVTLKPDRKRVAQQWICNCTPAASQCAPRSLSCLQQL